MSVKAMTWAFDQDLKTGPKFVLVALADHSDGDGVCWPGHQKVAEKCGISRQTVVEHIAFLEAAGFLRAESLRDAKGRVVRTRYFLAVDGPFEASPPPPEKAASMSEIPTRVHVGISGLSMSGLAVPYKEEPKAFEPPPTPKGDSLFEAKKPDLEGWFERVFWAAYPKRQCKSQALTDLRRLRPDVQLLDAIAAGLEHRLAAERHAKAKGAFFPAWPDPHRWLRKRRWEDHFEVPRETSTASRCRCGAAGVMSDGRAWYCAAHEPGAQRRAA